MRRHTDLPRIFTGSRRVMMGRLLLNGFGQAGLAFAIAWLTHKAMAAGPEKDFPVKIVGGLIFVSALVLVLRMLERTEGGRLGEDYVMNVRLATIRRIAALPQRMDGLPRFGVTMHGASRRGCC